MIIYCYNEHHTYLLFFDLEFDNRRLVQFAGLLFQKIDEDKSGSTYQLRTSGNQYRTPDDKVCYPFSEYTGLTTNFLRDNGVPLHDVKNFIEDEMLSNVALDQLEVISHGLKNDRMILLENEINLSNYVDKSGNKKPIDGYCTYKNAQRILQRNIHLKEEDIAAESGYYIHNAHNAFNDVWGEVSIFTFLKKIEQQKLSEAIA